MPSILVTNDDGVRSTGLLALAKALTGLGDVHVLAPENNWSASSHAKTMNKPLRVTPVTLEDGTLAHYSSGSPTDCVALAAGGQAAGLEQASGVACPYGLANDPYPGRCRFYVDSNGDGICDYSVPGSGSNLATGGEGSRGGEFRRRRLERGQP